jgi:hypothetical protein
MRRYSPTIPAAQGVPNGAAFWSETEEWTKPALLFDFPEAQQL